MAVLYTLDRDKDKKVEEKIATINPKFKKMVMSDAQRLRQEGRKEGESIKVQYFFYGLHGKYQYMR